MAQARRPKAKAKRKNSNYHYSSSTGSKNKKSGKNSKTGRSSSNTRNTGNVRKTGSAKSSGSSAAKKRVSVSRPRTKTSAAAGIMFVLSAVFFSFLILIQIPPSKRSYTSPSDFFGIFQWGGSSAASVAEGDLAVHYVDVGQGDCEIILTADSTVLIDSGEERYADSVISYIRSLGVQRLDYVIASHPHEDHIGGMAKILAAFPVGTVIMPELPVNVIPITFCYEQMLAAIESNDIRAVYAVPGREYDVGAGAVLKLLSPLHNDYNGLNNFSVACRLSHGENSFLFTGDIERASESDILNSRAEVASTVLKVAHHGSTSSSTPAFIKKVSPRYAVIEAGLDNSYGHPTETVLERLADVGAEVYCTKDYGDIVFVSDGTSLSIHTEKGTEDIAA